MSKSAIRTGGRFWGHVGLARIDAPTSSLWFPITAETATQIEELTSNCRPSEGWMAIETLSNRMLMVDPQQAMISLLDDGDEWPDGDSRQAGPLQDYAGIPTKIYRIMAAWAEQSGGFERPGSPADQVEALSLIESGGFADRPDALNAYLRHTRVHFSSGGILACRVDHRCLLELADVEGDADVEFVSVRQLEGVDRRLSLNNLAMIDMPLIELEAARSNLLECYE